MKGVIERVRNDFPSLKWDELLHEIDELDALASLKCVEIGETIANVSNRVFFDINPTDMTIKDGKAISKQLEIIIENARKELMN